MRLSNIFNLGLKEFRSLLRDAVLMLLIVYAFTGAIYQAASTLPETLNRAAIGIVDEDGSALSARIVAAFYPPYFVTPTLITPTQMDDRTGHRRHHLRARHPAQLPARRAVGRQARYSA